MRCPAARLRAALLSLAAAVACSSPPTDIVATSTEAIGEYHVTEAHRNERLVMRACVADGADTDQIAARIVQQLVNHGYSGIELELIGRAAEGGGAAVTKVTWSRTQGRRVEGHSRAAANPCAQQPGHEPSS